MMHHTGQKLDPVQIREASMDDLATILELNHHLHENEPLVAVDSRALEVWQSMIADQRLHCFIAEYNREPAASCMLDIVPNLTRGIRPFGVLQNVVTHKDYRGLGIGAKLNAYALDFAWKSDCYQVLVQTGRPEVVVFYERLGFRPDKIGLVAKPEWTEK
ncbi:MAG: GNAT family N-acetyltransferase [Bdellovibrionales bacterium]|nr:GNAT family N-acetyltransferase [Bdellovibrionales bacterium]